MPHSISGKLGYKQLSTPGKAGGFGFLCIFAWENFAALLTCPVASHWGAYGAT